MEDSKVQVVKALFGAFIARDMDAMLPLVDPKAEYFAPDTARLIGRTEPYVGFAGLQDYLRDIAHTWEEMRVVSQRYEPFEKGVVVIGRIVTRDKGGALIDAPVAWLVEVAAGKVTRVTLFGDQEKALREAGLGTR